MTALVATARTRAVPLALAVLLPLMSVEVARLLFYRGAPYAAVLAVLPAIILLQAAPTRLYGVVVLALAGTVMFGRDFSYLSVPAPRIGVLYVLDLVLLLVLVGALPAIAQAVRANQPQVFIVGAIVLWTVAILFRNPITIEALRQSVIGFYSLWVLVGMVLVAAVKSRMVLRAVYVGGLVGTVVFAIWLASNSNPFSDTFTPKIVASSFALYLGWGILVMLIAPSMIEDPRRRQLAYGVAVLQGAAVAASHSRSLWIAMIVALVGTAIVGGLTFEAKDRLVKFGFAFAGLAVVAALVLPATTSQLASVAGTIVSYNRAEYANARAEIKALDAQWRLERWGQALEQSVYPHPFTGVGFGGAIIEDPATRAAYIAVGTTPPRIDPHNSFIAFAGRLGLPGLALLLLFQVAVFRSASRVLRRRDIPDDERMLVAWLFACQLLVAGHSFFTVILEGPYMGIFFWLFGGMVIAHDHRLRHLAPAEEEEP
jgi:O-antigen ligase